MALVFNLFTLRLDNFANETMVLIAAANECSEQSNISVVSSANCDYLNKIMLHITNFSSLNILFCLSTK